MSTNNTKCDIYRVTSLRCENATAFVGCEIGELYFLNYFLKNVNVIVSQRPNPLNLFLTIFLFEIYSTGRVDYLFFIFRSFKSILFFVN